MVDSFLVGILLLLFSYFEDIMLVFLASIVSDKKRATILIIVPIHDCFLLPLAAGFFIFGFQQFDNYVPSVAFLYFSYLDSLPGTLG